MRARFSRAGSIVLAATKCCELWVTIEIGRLPWKSGLAAALARSHFLFWFYEQRLTFFFFFKCRTSYGEKARVGVTGRRAGLSRNISIGFALW